MEIDSLQRLKGTTLIAVDEIDGSVGLCFDWCMFRAFMPQSGLVPLAALQHSSVASVSIVPTKELAIHFVGEQSMRCSLAPASYIGLDAFVSHFAGRPNVVE